MQSVGSLGAGSDFKSFINVLGIPGTDFGYVVCYLKLELRAKIYLHPCTHSIYPMCLGTLWLPNVSYPLRQLSVG